MKYIILLLLAFGGVNVYAQQPKLVLPIGHTAYVCHAHFSNDGSRAVTWGYQNMIFIWDTRSAQLLTTIKWTNGEVKMWQLPVANPLDGDMVATFDQSWVSLWDVKTGEKIKTIDQRDRVNEMKFSHKGDVLLCKVRDSLINVCDVRSGKILYSIKNPAPLTSFGISEDDTRIVTTVVNIAYIWDAGSGKQLSKINTGIAYPYNTEVTPGNKKIVISEWPHMATAFDVNTGQKFCELKTDTFINEGDGAIAYFHNYISPDKKWIVTTSDTTVSVWDKKASRCIKRISLPSNVSMVGFSPDGSEMILVYGNTVQAIRVGDFSVTKEARYTSEMVFSHMVFSNDGKLFFTLGEDNTIEVWDKDSLKIISKLRGRSNPIIQITEDKIITKGVKDSVIRIWDLISGGLKWAIEGPREDLFYTAVDKQGKYLFTGYDVSNLLWNVSSGTLQSSVSGYANNDKDYNFIRGGRIAYHTDTSVIVQDAETGKILYNSRIVKGTYTRGVKLSYDGKKVYFDQDSMFFKIVNIEDGKELLSVRKGSSHYVSGYDFSKDSKKFAITYFDSTATAWDLATGTQILQLKGNRCLRYPDFNNNGDNILFNHVVPVFGDDHSFRGYMSDSDAEVYSLATGKLLYTINSNQVSYGFIAYFKNDDNKVIAHIGGAVNIFNANSGKMELQLGGHNGNIVSTVFSKDKKYIYTASEDNTVKKWTSTGSLLYTIIPVDSSDYLVVDRYYRYDGTPAARKLLYFSCGSEIVALDQVKDQLWVPGLRERIDNGDSINAKKLSDLDICGLTPDVQETVDDKNGVYRFSIIPRRGGIGEVVLYINDIEYKRYTTGSLVKKGNAFELTVKREDIKGQFIAGSENKVSVKAYTNADDISSRGITINIPATDVQYGAPDLYAVIIGVGDYKSDNLHLQYAVKDATDISSLIKLSAGKLLGKEHVFTYNLFTGKEHYLLPEKQGIHKVLEEIGKKAKPNDILLIFFSGHGATDNKSGQFYFLTADASSASVTDALPEVGISGRELTDWIQPSNIRAQKRVLIFDACNSGQIIKNVVKIGGDDQQYIAAKDDEAAWRVKAIDKLNERSGLFILAASASNQSAYELKKYSQGLLTYALLRIIKQQPEILDNNRYLDVNRWFGAAEKMVADLAKSNGTNQQPQVAGAGNFNIGVVDSDVTNSLHLAEERPLFTPCNFQNSDPSIGYDDLDLTSYVNNKLSSAAGEVNNDIEYTGTANATGAWKITGRYTCANDSIVVNAVVLYNNKLKYRIEVKGSKTDLHHLSEMVVGEMIKQLRNR